MTIECSLGCMVVAVIIPFRCCQDKKEFLFLNRGNEKWAFSGGNGGFSIAKDFQDFARIEFEYDTGLSIDEFCYLGTMMSSDNRQLTVCFTCELTSEIVSKGKWFSFDDIVAMAKDGKIAFDNDKLLEMFNQKFIPSNLFS